MKKGLSIFSERVREAVRYLGFGKNAADAFGLSDYSSSVPDNPIALFSEMSGEYQWNPYKDFVTRPE